MTPAAIFARASQRDPGYHVGALPPYSVSYIDPTICGGHTDRWFVMGTVNGDPRDEQGPVAVCEWEPSAHTICALLNATAGGRRGAGLVSRIWAKVAGRCSA